MVMAIVGRGSSIYALVDKMTEKTRILVIGLDGATFNLLLPWMEKGHLPFLKSFKEKGAWGYLETTVPVLTGAALPSFYTGQNPARTGIFHFVNMTVVGSIEQCIRRACG